jgi:hypothetical protein
MNHFQKTSALVFVMSALVVGSGCTTSPNNTPAPTPTAAATPPTPDNFIAGVQASSAGEGGSKILAESALRPGVLVIYDSALNTDMAVDLSANDYSFNSSGWNLETPSNIYVPITSQDTVNRYLQNTGSYARAVTPGSGAQAALYYDNQGNAYSQNTDTRDTDLQQADLQQADVATRASAMASNLQMSVESATQLVTIADKMQKLSALGSMTPADRDALTEASLNVAGITTGDVNQAIAATVQSGKTDQIDALMVKAANNLGMPSTDNLRTKLLPVFGINIGTAK